MSQWEIIALIIGNVAALVVSAGNLVAFFRLRAENKKIEAEANKTFSESDNIKRQADDFIFERLVRVIELSEADNERLRADNLDLRDRLSVALDLTSGTGVADITDSTSESEDTKKDNPDLGIN